MADNRGRMCAVLLVAVAVASMSQLALAEEQDNWSFSMGAGVVFDDNRDGAEDNKESLLELRVTPTAAFSLLDARSKLTVSYAPSFRYRDNPRYNQNETELYHDVNVGGERRISRRLWVTGSEYFSSTDDPAVMESGRTFRENASYWLNRVGLSARYAIRPGKMTATLRASHQIKRYDGDDFAEIADQDGLGGEVSLKYVTGSRIAILGGVSYATTELGSEYVGGDRGSQVLFIGAGLEKTLSSWSIRARVGADKVTYDNASLISETRPAADAHIVYRPTQKTAVDMSLRYHMVRGDISPYAAQSRASVVLTGAHELKPNLSVSLSGVYARGAYDVDTVALDAAGNLVDATKVDGTDTLASVQVGAKYQLPFRGLSLVGGYGFESWNADAHIRTSHRRNTLTLSLLADF